MNNERLHFIDCARGIGILLVVIMHSAFSAKLPAYGRITTFYMPLFYIVSGYLTRENKNFYEFIERKTRSLVIPYFICSAILIFFYAIINNDVNSRLFVWYWGGVIYSRFKILKEGNTPVLLKSYNAPLWFLTSMFTAQILFFVGLKKRWLFLLYVLISFGFIFCPLLLPWSLDTSFLSAVFIFVGYVLQNRDVFSVLNRKLPKLKSISVLITGICIYLVLVVFNGVPNYSIAEFGKFRIMSYFIFIIAATLGSFLLLYFLYLFENAGFKICILELLGKHSLYIMIFHVAVLRLTSFLNGYFSSYLFILIQLIFAIFIPILIDILHLKLRSLKK